MSFWDKLREKMTDDKGLFRGGVKGRMFGGLRDALQRRKMEMQLGDDYDELLDPYDPRNELDTGFSEAGPDAYRERRRFMGDTRTSFDEDNPENIEWGQGLYATPGDHRAVKNLRRYDMMSAPWEEGEVYRYPQNIEWEYGDEGGYGAPDSGSYDPAMERPGLLQLSNDY